MKQELIPLTAPSQWKEALQNLAHSFGHTWENCYSMYLTSGFPTYLYLLEFGDVKIVCPIAERVYKGYTDIVTPYGFSGFVGNKDFPDLQNYWKEFVLKRGYVCGYIGLNPMLVNKTYLPANELYEYNTLYVLNLDLSISDLFNQLSQNRKRQLKGFEDHLKNFTTDKHILKEFFLSNYHAFFTKKNVAQVYGFSLQTLSYVLDLENLVIIGFLVDGRVEAVSVFAFTVHGAEYLFNISFPEARHHTVLLLWYGIINLKSKNIPFLNLGGGVRDGDSISQFKQRFGAKQYPLKCLKQVYNQQIYTTLCQEANADPDYKEGYFPPYRKP